MFRIAYFLITLSLVFANTAFCGEGCSSCSKADVNKAARSYRTLNSEESDSVSMKSGKAPEVNKVNRCYRTLSGKTIEGQNKGSFFGGFLKKK